MAITPLPAAPQRLTDPDPVFVPKADAWAAALAPWTDDVNTLGDEVQDNADQTTADRAQTGADVITANAAAATAVAAAAAAAAVPVTPATSSTSMAIAGSGAKTFTLDQMGKAFAIGQSVKVTDTADITKFMVGVISAFNAGTGVMTIAVGSSGGAGTIATWTVALVPAVATVVADITDYASDQATKKAVTDGEFASARARLDFLELGAENPVILVNTAGTVPIDLSLGTDFKLAVAANISTMTVSNPPTTGTLKTFTLRLAFNGTSYTIAWPASFKFAAGAPSFDFTNGKEAVLTGYTDNAGTKYHVFFVGESG